MKIDAKTPPRKYRVGINSQTEISDMGDIHLAPDEQVTFVTDSGARHDFARKNWGFYVTPSINGRAKSEGFKTALVTNEQGRVYVMVVEEAQRESFEEYCREDRQRVIQWLDEYMPEGN